MKDPLEIFNNKAMSWSYYSSFLYSKDKWYAKYYLGEEQVTSDAMAFGKYAGDKINEDDTFLPDVPRYKKFEECLTGKLGNMKLLGYMDTSDLDNKKLRERKTGNNNNPWTQKKVDDSGQLTMYALLIHLSKGIAPEDLEIHLDWIPTLESGWTSLEDFMANKPEVRLNQEEKLQSFKTVRTTKDCQLFGAKLIKAHEQMEKFIHLRIKENNVY